jgi:hypothetical protein
MQNWPIARQTPGGRGIWGNCRFFINEPIKECDYWIVCDGLAGRDQTICPPGNTILITHEPPTIRRYRATYLKQFSTVITSHRDIWHHHPVYEQQALPWHVGRKQRSHVDLSWSKDYDELISIRNFNKKNKISVVCSSKKFSPGHKKRLEFSYHLKEVFGDGIDLFGRGIEEIEDKWDALASYKYHIAMENCAVDDYWTEKLSDAFLAGCHPVYYGCPNIGKYFNPAALTQIDINKPEKAIQTISACLENNTFEMSKNEIMKARLDVLNRYNVFPMIASLVEQKKQKVVSGYERVIIEPERSGGWKTKFEEIIFKCAHYKLRRSSKLKRKNGRR